MQSEGWIAIYRSLLDQDHDLHPFSNGDKACRLAAWIDLIGLAKWRAKSDLERGQLKMKQKKLAQRWNWHRSKVKRFLSELEETGRIQRDPQTGPKPTVVTICNYGDYQFSRPQTDRRSATGSTTYSSNDEEKQNRGRTRPRENGSKPSGPGDVTTTDEPCPDCSEPLNSNARGFYCPVCGETKHLEVA